MYKYIYHGKKGEAWDHYQARIQSGMAFPRSVHSFSHYIVRLWQWNPEDGDYTVEVLNQPGHQMFNSYPQALNCFNRLSGILPEQITETLKLELVQYHLGEIHPLQAKQVTPFVFTA